MAAPSRPKAMSDATTGSSSIPGKKSGSISVKGTSDSGGDAGQQLVRKLTLSNSRECTAYAWSERKKWRILVEIFFVQISMNWNAAIYANAVVGLSQEFGITQSQARVGQCLFLVMYALGCELWAPFSEEFGRRWIMQISLLLVNLWQIPCALAPNWNTVLVARSLGGLSSAGGSVTLGIVADMWSSDEQQLPLAFIVLSSVAGSVVAPIFGGIIQTYLPWPWVFYISLIIGAMAGFLHLLVVPETRPDILIAKEAKRRREQSNHPLHDPRAWAELETAGSFWARIKANPKAEAAKIGTLMWRPYRMLATEPIVTFLSLLSGFSDTLIFIGLSSFGMVLSKWNFSILTTGLSFLSLLISYFVAYAIFLPFYHQDRADLKKNPNGIKPERRLRLLLFLVTLCPIGLFGYAFTSLGPAYHVHWFGPLFFTFLIGIANFAIYMATIDYMVAAYGQYAASATGGNGFCRDLLAGIAALFATPMYENIGKGTDWQYAYPTLILAGIGALLIIPVYIFYFYGWWFRAKSPYAFKEEIENAEHEKQSLGYANPGAPSNAIASAPEGQMGSVSTWNQLV